MVAASMYLQTAVDLEQEFFVPGTEMELFYFSRCCKVTNNYFLQYFQCKV